MITVRSAIVNCSYGLLLLCVHFRLPCHHGHIDQGRRLLQFFHLDSYSYEWSHQLTILP